jgi:hypothetical protein
VKAHNLLFILFAAQVFAIGCGDDSDSLQDTANDIGGNETEPDTDSDTNADSDTDTNENISSLQESCMRQYELIDQCGIDVAGMPPPSEFEESCRLSADLYECEYEIFTDTCKSVYDRYIDCTATIDTCDEVSAYYDGQLSRLSGADSESEASDYPCRSELEAYVDGCIITLYIPIDENDECADKAQAYLDFMDPYLDDSTDPGSDTETDMSESVAPLTITPRPF